MIISGGENVYPLEVEEVLYEHPAVLTAAVVGVKDEKWGEMVTAAVTLKQGAEATEEEIIALCREKIAGYKCPSGLFSWNRYPPRPWARCCAARCASSCNEPPTFQCSHGGSRLRLRIPTDSA